MNLISEYGYTHTDGFDVALLEGVEDGYFSKEIVEKHAKELHQRLEADEAGAQFSNAWRKLSDTFNGDVNESLERFNACITANGKFYSLHDVISVVNMFRELGRKDDGDKLFDLYLAAREGIEDAYDLQDTASFGIHIDQDISDKLAAREEYDKPKYPADELFLMLSDDGYDRNVTERLAELPVDEYLRVLKSHNGREFVLIRRGLTQYNQLANPTEAHKAIIRKTAEALKQIAAENKFNEFKVSRWGIFEKVEWLDKRAKGDGTQPAS